MHRKGYDVDGRRKDTRWRLDGRLAELFSASRFWPTVFASDAHHLLSQLTRSVPLPRDRLFQTLASISARSRALTVPRETVAVTLSPVSDL